MLLLLPISWETGGVNIIKENCQYVAYVMEVILCCGQQELALCDHGEVDDQTGSVNTRNSFKILKLCSRHIAEKRSSVPRSARPQY